MRPKPYPREPFFIRFLQAVFYSLPLAASGALASILGKTGKKTRLVIYSLLHFAALTVILFIPRSFSFLITRFQGEGGFGILTGSICFYGIYLFATLPFFLFLSKFSNKGFGDGEYFTRHEKAGVLTRMQLYRGCSGNARAFIGMSLKTGRPVYLTDEQRLMHTEVVGSTGTGKTESVLLPILAHDIEGKKGAVVIDGKGDMEFLQRILSIVNQTGRRNDFYFFSLSNPEKSNTYNPLLRGNATELKDKLVGSMIWNEEFYRRMAEQATLTLLNALLRNGGKARFSKLHTYLTDLGALKCLIRETKDPALQSDLSQMASQHRNNAKFLSGLIADLYLMSHSEFSHLVDVEEPEIDLFRAYEERKIIYFQLNLQGYGDTAKRMGRMVLQDLRAVSSKIQSEIRESKRNFFAVFIDDASSFLDQNFIDFLSKSRASKLAITLLHQSLGDLIIKRDQSFQQQVLENTSIKIVLRQDDPQSVEKISRMGGTRKTMISTYQTEEKFTGKGFTGTGSIREGQTFRIEPDLIRSLKRGEAAIIWKNPFFHTDHLKLDFFGYPTYQEEPRPIRLVPEKPVPLQNEGESTENQKKVEEVGQSKVSPSDIPPDVTNPFERINQIKEKKARIKT